MLGHRLTERSGSALKGAIGEVARESNLSEVEVLAELANPRGRVTARILSRATVGETYFFRNPEQFRALARHAEAAQQAGHPLRTAWSVGCSTGEEVYSLVACLLPFAPALRVGGSDVSPAALEHARKGIYGDWALRAAPAAPVLRVSAGWEVVSGVRDRASFGQLNVASDELLPPQPLPPEVDLIVCRNLIVYLQPEVASRVVAGLAARLAPGGLLLLGPLDGPESLPPGTHQLEEASGFVLQRQEPAPGPSRPSSAEPLARGPPWNPASSHRAEDLYEQSSSLVERGLLDAAFEAAEELVRSFPEFAPGILQHLLLARQTRNLVSEERSRAVLVRLLAEHRDDQLLHGGLSVGYVRAILAEIQGVHEDSDHR